MNQKYHFGNNYLLTILLENIETIANPRSLEKVFEDFKTDYGAPGEGTIKKKN